MYDTTSQPLAALLSQAQQDGATLVVGPLLKENVDQLSASTTTLNVLALNQPETPKDNLNICYFALSPEDEARDAARHIWEQQKRQPLLLVPRGAFGDRVARAFNQEWQKQGGQTVLRQDIGSAGELRQMVNSGGIRMTGTPMSSAPAPQSVTIAGLTIPAPPSDVPAATGGSVDAVYIVATQSQLTLIKPMIDMATSSRGKPAMYASSRSYQAGAPGLPSGNGRPAVQRYPAACRLKPSAAAAGQRAFPQRLLAGAPVCDGDGCLDIGQPLC